MSKQISVNSYMNKYIMELIQIQVYVLAFIDGLRQWDCCKNLQKSDRYSVRLKKLWKNAFIAKGNEFKMLSLGHPKLAQSDL